MLASHRPDVGNLHGTNHTVIGADSETPAREFLEPRQSARARAAQGESVPHEAVLAHHTHAGDLASRFTALSQRIREIALVLSPAFGIAARNAVAAVGLEFRTAHHAWPSWYLHRNVCRTFPRR